MGHRPVSGSSSPVGILGLAFLELLLALAATPGMSHAQYMYLDANGDGLNTAADTLNAVGTATVVDVYLITNQNADGSEAVCNALDGTPLSIHGYYVALTASGGSVTYGSATNRLASAFLALPSGSSGNDFLFGRAGSTIHPPGTYHLLTLTITVLSGRPSLAIVAENSLALLWGYNTTAFFSTCYGNDFDNVYKLAGGVVDPGDWTDVSGLGDTPDLNCAPLINRPFQATGIEGAPIAITATAADCDGEQLVTLSQTNNAPFLAGPAATPFMATATLTLSGTPSYTQAGTYTITWLATDDFAPPATRTAATTIRILEGDRPPVVSAPSAVQVHEASALQITVEASDPDGEAITGLIASGAAVAAGATFAAGPGNTSGILSWTPGYHQAGVYTVTFRATNAQTGTASTSITVLNTDRPPQVLTPPGIGGSEGLLISFTAIADDPDGDPIGSLTAPNLPPGATFTSDSTGATGTFAWRPSHSQSGSYAVTVVASNGLTASATTMITVLNVDQPPTVTAPGTVTLLEGEGGSFDVLASDPDGDAVDSLTAGSLPQGASFAVSATNSQGQFSWSPGYDQAGEYLVTLSAKSACRATGVSGMGGLVCAEGVALTTILVEDVDRAPSINCPPTVSGTEGGRVSFDVHADDPDGDAVQELTALDLPVGATFSVEQGQDHGTFDWTPGFSQAGSYTISIRAANALATIRQVVLQIIDLNRGPIAVAGGPYEGVIGTAVSMDGSASWDPDGDALGYTWGFGDGASGSGSLVQHAYNTGGTYVVTLDVSDGAQSASTTTSAAIRDQFEGRAFTTGGDRAIRLGSGKPTWCAQVEPVNASYSNASVILSSIRVSYAGTWIRANDDKMSVGGDNDGNGIQELTACFAKTDVRTLFAGLPSGVNTVAVLLEGDLSTGGRFQAELSVEVIGTGGVLAATLSPNPLSPDGILTFETTKPGRATVSTYDLHGRLIRVIDAGHIAAGFHDILLDGRRANGTRLSSGIYFYRIETREGAVTGQFAVMK